MDRKAMANETLQIIKQGYYEWQDKSKTGQSTEKRQVIIKDDIEKSIKDSILISPANGKKILEIMWSQSHWL